MMNEADQPLVNEGAQRPTTGLSGDDQMAARRNFQVLESKNFSLETNAVAQFIEFDAFADYDVFHCWGILNC